MARRLALPGLSKKVVLQTAPRDAGFIDVFGDRVVTRQGGDFFPFAAGISSRQAAWRMTIS